MHINFSHHEVQYFTHGKRLKQEVNLIPKRLTFYENKQRPIFNCVSHLATGPRALLQF